MHFTTETGEGLEAKALKSAPLSSRDRRKARRLFQITAAAEQLVLDGGVFDFRMDTLAEALGLAKGTLYRYFKSKDALLMHLITLREEELLFMLSSASDAETALRSCYEAQIKDFAKTLVYQQIEEQIAASDKSVISEFKRLYEVRRARARKLIELCGDYITQCESQMSVRDFLGGSFALVHGSATLLNSSFYQRYMGECESLKRALLEQIMALPKGSIATDASDQSKSTDPQVSAMPVANQDDLSDLD